MSTTATSRIATALMSVTMTLFLLNAVALLDHPRPANSKVHIAGKTTTVVASALRQVSFTDLL